MNLYIARHGNTFDKGDIVTRVGGRTDLSLSISGREQAKALSRAFASINLGACYSSPLRRTMGTAEAICSPHDLTIKPAEFLREIDYGPDENKPETQVVARLGQKAILDWDEMSKVPNGWNVDPDMYIKAWSDFVTTLTLDNTLVVTSNGVARFVIDALDLQVNHRKLLTGSVAKLTRTSGVWSVDYWGLRPPFLTSPK